MVISMKKEVDLNLDSWNEKNGWQRPKTEMERFLGIRILTLD